MTHDIDINGSHAQALADLLEAQFEQMFQDKFEGETVKICFTIPETLVNEYKSIAKKNKTSVSREVSLGLVRGLTLESLSDRDKLKLMVNTLYGQLALNESVTDGSIYGGEREK